MFYLLLILQAGQYKKFCVDEEILNVNSLSMRYDGALTHYSGALLENMVVFLLKNTKSFGVEC